MPGMPIRTHSKPGKENDRQYMFSPITISLKYFSHLISSSNGTGHGIHSPFVFKFVTEVLNDNSVYTEYEVVENMRRKLLADNTPLPVEDYGARASVNTGSRSVRE